MPRRSMEYEMMQDIFGDTVPNRCSFFAERVVNIWNSLSNSVDFSSVARFKRTVKGVNFSNL